MLTKFLQGSVVTQTVFGGLTIHPLVAVHSLHSNN